MKEEIDFHEMEARCFSVCWFLGSGKGEEREREETGSVFQIDVTSSFSPYKKCACIVRVCLV